MRPLKLVMEAFGPFAEREVVNFGSLGDAPLFLINGPTGAGKTMLLDGICFALYGQSTGDERQGAELRCDRAAADTLTRVELEFQLGAERYRVERIPEQDRPKSRGAGFTRQTAAAHLWRCRGDDEELIATRKVTEVTDAIIDLTGLSADQFRQVMVLPQGQFRRLLIAESREREDIFQNLFQTGVYRQLQEALAADARALKGRIEGLQQNIAGALKGQGFESLTDLDDAITESATSLAILDEKRREANAVHAKAADALQQARQLQLRFIALDEATRHLDQLNANRETHETRAATITAAESAARIEGTHRSCIARLAEHDAALDALNQATQLRTDLKRSLPRPVADATRHGKLRSA
jgi:DNA repair protein SbcC/Rad50